MGSELVSVQPAIAVALVPVRIRRQESDEDVITYAALDPYSTDTFVKEDLLETLKVKGQQTEISLTTMASKNNLITVKVVQGLEVSDLEAHHTIPLPSVLAYKDLPVDRGDIPSMDQIKKWPHLAHLPLVWSTAQVGILIGMNVPGALRPLEVIHGNDDQPYAIKTKLGWTVHGPMGDGPNQSVKSNRIRVDSLEIEKMLHMAFNKDFQDHAEGNLPAPSLEDQRWEELVRESTTLENGHYTISLPFRNLKPKLPNNKHLAIWRCESLKRRLNKDEIFGIEYKRVKNELLSNEFGEPVHEQHRPEEGEVFYIPHHGVFNPRKPGKLRVVFDCASQ